MPCATCVTHCGARHASYVACNICGQAGPPSTLLPLVALTSVTNTTLAQQQCYRHINAQKDCSKLKDVCVWYTVQNKVERVTTTLIAGEPDVLTKSLDNHPGHK